MKKTDIDEIEGAFILESSIFTDLRGKLLKPYISKTLDNIWGFQPMESWFTVSHANVIRAMHMQLGEKPGRKVVCLISGEIEDVLLDTRKGVSTYGNTFRIKLSSLSNELKIICIPTGVAHGYRTFGDNTVVMYMSDVVHDSDSDIGYHWNSIGIDWQVENPIISERDKQLPNFIPTEL
jgi:dTDP-4-dehydrorhamnose 3,5-epimerase